MSEPPFDRTQSLTSLSYPSVTASAAPAVYTGPSVESFASPPSNSISSGGLGAAVAVPLLALIAIVVGYVTWNRSRKRPEKKRWSQAIDQRMSMVSDGTWAPPRASMSSTRPGSMIDPSRPSLGHRPSNSFHSNRASFHQQAYGANGSPLRNSSYNVDGSNRVSPLGEGVRRPSMATGSPSPNGEMRQIGQGERQSRVSFAGGERPLTMVGGRARSSIGGTPASNRASAYGRRGPAMRSSVAGSLISNEESPPKPIGRSGTKEELANAVFVTNPQATPTRLFGPPSTTHRRQASISSSLRQEISGPLPPGSSPPRSPFSDEHALPRPPPAMMSSHMPMAKRDSMVSPDQAMASYHARARDVVPSLPTLPSGSGTNMRRSPLVRSATFLRVRTILRSLSGLATNKEEESEQLEEELSSSDSKDGSNFDQKSQSSPRLNDFSPLDNLSSQLRVQVEGGVRRGSASPTLASVYSRKEEE